ncbi:hypothetical protein ACFUN8_18120 [Streptomyces sp. NPDC057307]|uniref:hypothetical protein n=1 Tax=Streptomyces sp. NPDC057307 TaxID=3346096 RepID=UPI0036365E54
MPERTLMGIVARTAYWLEWWRRFGPPSGNNPKLDVDFTRLRDQDLTAAVLGQAA